MVVLQTRSSSLITLYRSGSSCSSSHTTLEKKFTQTITDLRKTIEIQFTNRNAITNIHGELFNVCRDYTVIILLCDQVNELDSYQTKPRHS